jgi:hypothetical protein
MTKPIIPLLHNFPPVEDVTKEEVLAFMQRNIGTFFSSNAIGEKFNLGKNAARNRLEALIADGEIERSMDKRLVSYFIPAPAGSIGLSREHNIDKPLSEDYKRKMRHVYELIDERRIK